jgi:hypothetical protein
MDISRYIPRGSDPVKKYKGPPGGGGLDHPYVPQLPVLTIDISHYVPQKSSSAVEHKCSPYIPQYADV